MLSYKVYVNGECPGYELREVKERMFEVWKDGDHLGNYQTEYFGSGAWADGFFAALISAKKD